MASGYVNRINKAEHPAACRAIRHPRGADDGAAQARTA
jgi:hypothetical protein